MTVGHDGGCADRSRTRVPRRAPAGLSHAAVPSNPRYQPMNQVPHPRLVPHKSTSEYPQRILRLRASCQRVARLKQAGGSAAEQQSFWAAAPEKKP